MKRDVCEYGPLVSSTVWLMVIAFILALNWDKIPNAEPLLWRGIAIALFLVVLSVAYDIYKGRKLQLI